MVINEGILGKLVKKKVSLEKIASKLKTSEGTILFLCQEYGLPMPRTEPIPRTPKPRVVIDSKNFREKQYTQVSKPCLFCGNIFTGLSVRKFCSVKCRTLASRSEEKEIFTEMESHILEIKRLCEILRRRAYGLYSKREGDYLWKRKS